MPKLWKYKNSGAKAISDYCVVDVNSGVDKCRKKMTQSTVFVIEPYPDLLMLNINWYSDQIGYMDNFYFSMSIAQTLRISDMFELSSKTTVPASDYFLKGVVCFVGAHYFSFIHQMNDKTGRPEWLLFDDYKPIRVYDSWEGVLYNIIHYGNLPTLLLYEKVTKVN